MTEVSRADRARRFSFRAPYQVYTDPELHALEQLRLFQGPTWNFLGTSELLVTSIRVLTELWPRGATAPGNP